MASFSLSITDAISKSSQTIACINSYIEYAQSKLTDISNWISDDNNTQLITLPIEGVKEGLGVFALSKEEYLKAINGENNVSIIDNENVSHTIAADDLLSAFEDNISEMRVQSIFMDYCKSAGDKISSSSFISRVKGLFNDVIPSVMEKYTAILDRSGDSLDAFYGFFNLTSNAPTQSDYYITLVDGTQFEGSVWSTAVCTIGSQISGFFEGVWQGISKLDVFFKNLLEATGKLVKWVLNKMFHQLTTVYEIQNEDPSQLMDLPLIQCDLGTSAAMASDIQVIINKIAYDGYLYGSLRNNICFDVEATFQSYGLTSTIRTALSRQIKWDVNQTVDGHDYVCVHDCFIPCQPFSFLTRLGKTKDNHYILNLYVCFTKGVTSQLSDDDIFENILTSLQHLPDVISSVTPWGHKLPNTALAYQQKRVNYSGVICNPIRDENNEYVPLYDSIKNNLFNCSLEDIADEEVADYATSTCYKAEVILSLLMWIFYMGKPETDETQDLSAQACYKLWNNEVAEASQIYDVAYDAGTFASSTYRPYTKSNPTIAAIHYQNIDEQANEIVKLFWGVVIAVTAIVVTAKLMKWCKARKQSTHLAQAAMDSNAWHYADNPTPENLAAYQASRNKYRKMNRLNKILGIASSADDISNLIIPDVSSGNSALLKLIAG